MLKAKLNLIVLLFCGMAATDARAQDAAPPVPVVPAAHLAAQTSAVKAADLAGIDSAIKGNDNFEVQQALDNAIEFLTDGKNSQKAAEKVPLWVHMLITLRRFDEVEDFALAAINARPTDIRLIETCQQARIRAKLLQNQPQLALSLSKGFYNVCAMPDTSKAIDLISECLYDLAAESDPVGAVKKFKLEQIKGAATTQPSDADASTLSKIQIDPKPYAVGLEHADLVDNDWQASMGKGNLLLLSGQAREATKVFQKAYSLASDNNLAAATESVARAMRAEDGTVGRANAWILSLRPPEQAAQ